MIGKKYGIDNIDYLDIINITYILNSIEILRKLINIFHYPMPTKLTHTNV